MHSVRYNIAISQRFCRLSRPRYFLLGSGGHLISRPSASARRAIIPLRPPSGTRSSSDRSAIADGNGEQTRSDPCSLGGARIRKSVMSTPVRCPPPGNRPSPAIPSEIRDHLCTVGRSFDSGILTIAGVLEEKWVGVTPQRVYGVTTGNSPWTRLMPLSMQVRRAVRSSLWMYVPVGPPIYW